MSVCKQRLFKSSDLSEKYDTWVYYSCFFFLFCRLLNLNKELEETVKTQKKKIADYESQLKAKQEEINSQRQRLEELKSILTHVKVQDGAKTPEPTKVDVKKRMGKWSTIIP